MTCASGASVPLILSVDQSTSATKAFLFDRTGCLVEKASVPHGQTYPRPGWVEQNPADIFKNTLAAIDQVLQKAGIDDAAIPSRILALSSLVKASNPAVGVAPGVCAARVFLRNAGAAAAIAAAEMLLVTRRRRDRR